MPLRAQDAAWVLMERKGCSLVYRGNGEWEYTQGDRVFAQTPWEAVIAAAYALEVDSE